MGALEFYAANGFWMWLVLAAGLLALEVATGTGWLLWPSASAALTGVAALAVHLSPLAAVLLFAVVTIVSTLLARRYLPADLAGEGADINDNIGRLVGQRGEAVGAFVRGSGRVFIDGKEWAADLEGDEALGSGAAVVVTGVSGARLSVRPD